MEEKMKSKVYWAFGVLFAVGIMLSACAAPAAQPTAPTALPSTAVPTTAPTAASAQAKPAVVTLAKDATLGRFLADEKGMTLYLFTKDDKNTSNCYDACATSWPPPVE
jgi:predicted lipoprotein with Yx(FWY)xxD motif